MTNPQVHHAHWFLDFQTAFIMRNPPLVRGSFDWSDLNAVWAKPLDKKKINTFRFKFECALVMALQVSTAPRAYEELPQIPASQTWAEWEWCDCLRPTGLSWFWHLAAHSILEHQSHIADYTGIQQNQNRIEVKLVSSQPLSQTLPAYKKRTYLCASFFLIDW